MRVNVCLVIVSSSDDKKRPLVVCQDLPHPAKARGHFGQHRIQLARSVWFGKKKRVEDHYKSFFGCDLDPNNLFQEMKEDNREITANAIFKRLQKKALGASEILWDSKSRGKLWAPWREGRHGSYRRLGACILPRPWLVKAAVVGAVSENHGSSISVEFGPRKDAILPRYGGVCIGIK